MSFKSVIKSADNDISLIKNFKKEEYDSGINTIEKFIDDIRKESLSQKEETPALPKEIVLVYFDVKKNLLQDLQTIIKNKLIN